MIYIDGYPIDAALVEDHALESEVTDHPVEKGSPITDHIANMPEQITFDCVVSDHPFGEIARLRATFGVLVPGQTTEGILPSADVYNRLREIRDRKEPVTVESSLGTHDNMAVKSLSIPRKSDDGEALRFRISFKKIEIAENERTTVKVAVPKAAKKVNRGNKPAEPVPNKKPEKSSSILYKLVH